MRIVAAFSGKAALTNAFFSLSPLRGERSNTLFTGACDP